MNNPEQVSPEVASAPEQIREVRCLLIDDFAPIILGMNLYFEENKDFLAVQCDTVEKAMAEIYKYMPKKLFLDHNLTSTTIGQAGEGLQIARRVRNEFPGIELFLISVNERVIEEYIKEGINIKYIHKGEMGKIGEAISN
jgi:hypothetical protein